MEEQESKERLEISPGLLAAVDQDCAAFATLAERLMQLHLEVVREIECEAGAILRSTRMRETQMRMMRTIGEELFLASEPERVFKFLLFLIDALMRERMDLGDLDPGEPDHVTGTGQKLFNVHRPSECQGWCVIHKPLPGPWEYWPTHWRGDDPFDIWTGFERVCPHGVGHPAVEEALRGNPHLHGCCVARCPCGPGASGVQEVLDDQGELTGYQLSRGDDGPDDRR